jgi:hypothetical protein
MNRVPPEQHGERDGDDAEGRDAGGAADVASRDQATTVTSNERDEPGNIPPDKRRERKRKDKYRCRSCGVAGPGAGGVAELNVHHADPNPGHCELHAMRNLITLCENCHSWLHKKPTVDTVPITLSEDDRRYLRPNDYDILRFLYEEGPAMASDVTAAVTADVTEVAVRERLWLLMGLDRIVASREEQLIDRDAETGEWGPPGQIAQSVRGRIPGDVQTLLQRIEDEVVRQAVARGCDRETVADVLDIHSRTTWIKERRAYACAFPLDALSRGDAVPAADSESAAGSRDASVQLGGDE